ncbi:hypothetical protein GGR56DRAFT_463136 [Xylariaceae sp. FL0804]|nr:hypothetical protein GGR56DRAFT_463136 [Xylariaceae sp. FL0804]
MNEWGKIPGSLTSAGRGTRRERGGRLPILPPIFPAAYATLMDRSRITYLLPTAQHKLEFFVVWGGRARRRRVYVCVFVCVCACARTRAPLVFWGGEWAERVMVVRVRHRFFFFFLCCAGYQVVDDWILERVPGSAAHRSDGRAIERPPLFPPAGRHTYNSRGANVVLISFLSRSLYSLSVSLSLSRSRLSHFLFTWCLFSPPALWTKKKRNVAGVIMLDIGKERYECIVQRLPGRLVMTTYLGTYLSGTSLVPLPHPSVS